MDALRKFGEHLKTRVALDYRLEQLLRFFRALQTSRVYPLLNIRTLSMNQFLKIKGNFNRLYCCQTNLL